MKIKGYTLSSFKFPQASFPLYAHQINVFENWDKEALLLLTKTGSGKTASATLPIIKNQEAAIYIYPTNALMNDQMRSIKFIMEREHISYREVTPQNIGEKFEQETYAIIEVNAARLKEYQEFFGVKSNSEVLLRLIRLDKKKLILMNPDILYYLLSLRYGRVSADILSHLSGYSTIVIDEFHLYTGVELSNIMFMLFLCKKMGLFQRFVFLSATPDDEVLGYLDRLFHPVQISQSEISAYPFAKRKVIAHTVELNPLAILDAEDVLKLIAEKILSSYKDMLKLKLKHKKQNVHGSYVPMVVILNSVIDAITLEDLLVEGGIDRGEIGSIRGLASKEMRDVRGKTIVVGTSAIEVGVDFQMDCLIFEAGDVASFMQRFGRLGRHSRGSAFVLVDKFQEIAFQSFGAELKRNQLESLVKLIYPHQNARAWFLNTFSGMISVFSQTHYFLKVLTEDKKADAEERESLRKWLFGLVDEYAKTIGIDATYKKTLPKLERQWFRDYLDVVSFRNSTPNIEVWDTAEKKRGRTPWNYEVDMRMLLRRGVNFRREKDRLIIDGYARKGKPVYVQKGFSDPGLIGTYQTTRDFAKGEVNLLIDGEITPISDIMYREKPHLFVVAPRSILKFLDWKIGWYYCGKSKGNIIAFDGDALLMREIYAQYFHNKK